ncbi:MAG: hypothetical protein GX993_01500 [Bacteroidales bacterium]|nr:hypothetical protein [Bacteroidales bacterium]
MFKKIGNWYRAQSDTTKAFIWIGLICLIGIAFRWRAIIEGVAKGFNFFSNK